MLGSNMLHRRRTPLCDRLDLRRYTTAIDASHSLPKNSTIDASLSLIRFLSLYLLFAVFSITTSTIEIHDLECCNGHKRWVLVVVDLILLKKKQEQGKNKLLSHLSLSVVEDKEAKFYGCKVGGNAILESLSTSLSLSVVF
ncbi:hypothetical protein L2E82_43697 [Cichorium intybus]|uniref:Uncharacterized protein n=1 Tax=Cichorium intybus TaxID=13427 RepID=A0ACB8ZNX0_CICIN|nr:hypothetical protein L2E82_43697 [Cichorium intybus]